ncbi:MAG: hypothetical protein Q7T81_14720 [Pseudolabrys sp.]|nr:hypothetical protein [Pseudolabrys sp.]
MLKRAIIFPLLGPPLLVAIHTVPLTIISRATGFFEVIFALIPTAFYYGALPALISGLVDHYLAKWLTPLWRAVSTGIFASLLAGGAFVTIGIPGLWGLAGFAPAAACSAISWWLDERGI